MPLLGKLSSDAIQQILQVASSTQSNAVLHIHTPDEQGTVTITDGQVTRINHKHQHLEQTLELLSSSAEGHFQLCQPGEPAPPESAPTTWLLDRDQGRGNGIAGSFGEINYQVNTLVDFEHALSLLAHMPPALFLIEGALAVERQGELLGQLQLLPTQQLPKLMLVGPPGIVPDVFESIGAEWFSWPASNEEIKQRIGRWVQPHQNPQKQAESVLELLSTFAPYTPELKVRLHPSRRQELTQNHIAPAWSAWLETLHLQQPLEFFLQNAPGPIEFARVLVYNLLQLGYLTTQDITEDEDVLLADATEAPPPLQLHKVIALGLRGTWKEDWIKSLKKISQNQAARIPREHPFPVPHFPKIEHARIPLRKDTLLVVYGARNEDVVDQIVEKTNRHITGFLYFAEHDNIEELNHINFMRQNIESRLQSRHLFMIAAPAHLSDQELRDNIQAQPDDLVVSLQRFDLHSTHTALQTLLQSFTKK